MKYLMTTSALALFSTASMASDPIQVPEMSIGPGFAAIALVVGIAAIIRERGKRK